MRKKRICLLWILFTPVLLLLYLLSSTDLLIQERTKEVYPISVILDSVTDEAYTNFKKGMDRAALELNADVTLLTLYEEGNAAQQLDRMRREQQDGIRALIVFPVQETKLERALNENQLQLPLVLVNAECLRDKVSAAVTTDYQAMGRELAKRLAEEQEKDLLVYLFGSKQETAAERHFASGIEAVLLAEGYRVQRVEPQKEQTFHQVIEELAYPDPKQAVIVALSPEILAKTASVLADSPVYAGHVTGLYGRGTTPLLLNYLDRGVIDGLCVTDDFSTGYFSVCRAVELLKNQKPEKEIVLDSYYIRREDLRKPEYEKLLYPME